MPWASKLYNLEFLPGTRSTPDFYACHWDALEKQPKHLLGGPLPPMMDRAESSESESSSGTDSESDDVDGMPKTPPRDTRHPYCSNLGASTSDSSLNGSPVQCALPQRPGTAITRNANRAWGHRPGAAVRMSARSSPYRNMLPANLTPITNDGLYLPSKIDQNSVASKPRSEDRIRAAQRLFHALGQSSRTEAATKDEQPTARPEHRPRMSFLHGLTAQAHRRNSRPKIETTGASDLDMPQFAPTMHGTQQCVIATQTSTISLVITPPSPRPDGDGDGRTQVSGVRITSHNTRESSTGVSQATNLSPPPFELAPGRARQIALRRQQAAQQMMSQYARYKQTTASPTNAPTALKCNATGTHPTAIQTSQGPGPQQTRGPLKETLTRRNCGHSPPPSHDLSTCKYVPPGRRRRMPGQTAHSPLGARVSLPIGNH